MFQQISSTFLTYNRLYSHADWDKAREKLEEFHWDGIISEDVNHSWAGWYSSFMSIMEECIPRKVLPSQRKLPWLNKNIKSAMRRRNTLFKKTGYSAKFRSARNRVIANYFKKSEPQRLKEGRLLSTLINSSLQFLTP